MAQRGEAGREHRQPLAAPDPLLLRLAQPDHVRIEADRAVVDEHPAVHLGDVDRLRRGRRRSPPPPPRSSAGMPASRARWLSVPERQDAERPAGAGEMAGGAADRAVAAARHHRVEPRRRRRLAKARRQISSGSVGRTSASTPCASKAAAIRAASSSSPFGGAAPCVDDHPDLHAGLRRARSGRRRICCPRDRGNRRRKRRLGAFGRCAGPARPSSLPPSSIALAWSASTLSRLSSSDRGHVAVAGRRRLAVIGLGDGDAGPAAAGAVEGEAGLAELHHAGRRRSRRTRRRKSRAPSSRSLVPRVT